MAEAGYPQCHVEPMERGAQGLDPHHAMTAPNYEPFRELCNLKQALPWLQVL